MDDSWFDAPSNWSTGEADVFEHSLDNVFDDNPSLAGEMAHDEWLQFLYDEVFYGDYSGEDRAILYQTLVDYVDNEYDIEWEDIFDWEGWRKDYDAISA
jgi:hypothetical protein